MHILLSSNVVEIRDVTCETNDTQCVSAYQITRRNNQIFSVFSNNIAHLNQENEYDEASLVTIECKIVHGNHPEIKIC